MSAAADAGAVEAKALGLVWVKPKTEGAGPSARGGHSAVASGPYMIIFGGQFYGEDGVFVYLNDVHVLDLETMTWHEPKCGGTPPAPRYGHTAHLVGSRMFIIGGRGRGGALHRDMTYLDTATWQWHEVQMTTSAPLGRLQHASALVDNKIVVFGGWDGTASLDDFWLFDTETMGWMQPRTTGIQPTARHGASLDILPDGRLLLFGGCRVEPRSAPQYLSDVAELDTNTMVWSRGSVIGEYPVPRFWQTSFLLGNTVLYFGGWAGTDKTQLSRLPKSAARVPSPRRVGYLIALDGDDMRWNHPPFSGRPPINRYGHSVVRVGGRVYVWGGWDGNRAMRELHELIVVDADAEAAEDAAAGLTEDVERS